MLPVWDGHPQQRVAGLVRDGELQPESIRGPYTELPKRVQGMLHSGMEIRQIDALTIFGFDVFVADVEEKARHRVLLSRIGLRQSP
jgi:hypothetical protein